MFAWLRVMRSGSAAPSAAPCRAGELLRSAALPAALQAVTADPAEHALYLGGADGRIFELSLVPAHAACEAGKAASAACAWQLRLSTSVPGSDPGM